MRKSELSFLNVIFCLLVIFIHISSYPLGGYEAGSIPYNIVLVLWRLASFVVQGFVLLSGLKMFLSGKDKPYLKMLKGKLKTIIVPYVFWYVIYYIFYMIIADYPLDIRFIAKHFFLGSLAPHTYFVPLIMEFFLLYPLWKVIVRKVKPYVAIPVAIIISLLAENVLPVILYNNNITFPYNDRIFTTYLSYWIIGCYIGANYETFKAFFKKHSLLIPFILIIIVNIIFTYINYNVKYLIYLNVIHFVYSVTTILYLFEVFLKVKNTNKLIQLIDNSSYTIYLCHMLFVFASNYFFATVSGIQSNILLFFAMAITVYPMSVITSAIIKGPVAKCIDMHK